MSRAERKKTPPDNEALLELGQDFRTFIALGVVHSETNEAKLARVPPGQRNQIRERVEQIQRGLPPIPINYKDEEAGENGGE